MQRDGVVPAPMMYRKVADAPVRLPSDGNHHLVLAGRNIRRRQTADRVIRGNTDTSDDGSHGGIPISRQELIAQRITGWDRWCTPSATAAGCAWQSCPTAFFQEYVGRDGSIPGARIARDDVPARAYECRSSISASGFDRLDGGLPPTIACPPGWGSTQEQFRFGQAGEFAPPVGELRGGRIEQRGFGEEAAADFDPSRTERQNSAFLRSGHSSTKTRVAPWALSQDLCAGSTRPNSYEGNRVSLPATIRARQSTRRPP